MEVDPAVVGGVIAGVVGVGLGVGAMIFTEQQTLRREERKVRGVPCRAVPRVSCCRCRMVFIAWPG